MHGNICLIDIKGKSYMDIPFAVNMFFRCNNNIGYTAYIYLTC